LIFIGFEGFLRAPITLFERKARSIRIELFAGTRPAALRACGFDAEMLVRSQKRAAMGHADASRTFDRQDKRAIRVIGPLTRWRVGVTGLAGAMMIAGALVAFSSGKADAKPAYVTKAHPCGSCHPPNKPPKK
jgi:hypothetical protein